MTRILSLQRLTQAEFNRPDANTQLEEDGSTTSTCCGSVASLASTGGCGNEEPA